MMKICGVIFIFINLLPFFGLFLDFQRIEYLVTGDLSTEVNSPHGFTVASEFDKQDEVLTFCNNNGTRGNHILDSLSNGHSVTIIAFSKTYPLALVWFRDNLKTKKRWICLDHLEIPEWVD